MANDCLVTQLKGVVDDNSLSTLGVITLEAVKGNSISSASNQQVIMMQYTASNSGDISVESPGAVSNDPTTVDAATSTSLTVGASYTTVAFKNENYKIFVANKFKLRYFIGRGSSGYNPIFTINLSEFDYAESLQELNLMYMNNVNGSIKYLSHSPLLTDVKLADCSDVSGNIKELSTLTSLTLLTLQWTKAKGELTDLAAGQVANGRTSGTLIIKTSAYITLNGALVGDNVQKTITFDSSLPNGYSIA